METILRLFPKPLYKQIKNKVYNRWGNLEEIRLRQEKLIELNFHTHSEWINGSYFSQEDCIYVLNQLSEHSLYRLEDELREGYITISGGHRVGLAGGVTTEFGKIKQLQYITFFNIRIAKQVAGIAAPFIHYLHEEKQVKNTLIIGAPQTGKTTILRDIAKLIGDGWQQNPPKKVGIIDERSEIAASLNGVAQHQVGSRTDVLDACPKVEGMMMMIRSMSPEVLIIDEIGKEQDVQALMEAIHAGVTIICTVHGSKLSDLQMRPSLQPLFNQKVFSRYMMLSRKKEVYTDISVWNSNEELLFRKDVKKQ